MKLTSHLLLETLSDSDYIMVNVSDTSCTDHFIQVNSYSRQLIEHCVNDKLDNTSFGISLHASCQEFNRYLAMLLTYPYMSYLNLSI